MVDYKNPDSEKGLVLADGLGKAVGYGHESSQETIETTTVDKRYLESLKGFVGQSLMTLLDTTKLDSKLIQNSVESIQERIKCLNSEELSDYAKTVEDPEALDKLLREDKRSYYAIMMKLKEKKPETSVQGLLNEVILTCYEDTDTVDTIYSSGSEIEIADNKKMYAHRMVVREEVRGALLPYMVEQKHIINRVVSTVNGLVESGKQTSQKVEDTRTELVGKVEAGNKKTTRKLLVATLTLAAGIGAAAYFGRDYIADTTAALLTKVDDYRKTVEKEVKGLKDSLPPQMSQNDLERFLENATGKQRKDFEDYLRKKEEEERSREFFRNQ